MCPNCQDPEYSPVVFSRSEHKPVCENCGTAFSEFIEDRQSTIISNK
jgi:ribosomal protein S27E